MFESKYSKAVKEWRAAEERLLASEERIGHAFIDWFFRQEATSPRPSRPCVNVTPPKSQPKK